MMNFPHFFVFSVLFLYICVVIESLDVNNPRLKSVGLSKGI